MLKLFLSSTLLFLLQTASAQLQLGIKAGVNISNFTGGNFENFENEALVSGYGGGYLRFRLGDMIAIQPEVLFSSQGAKLKSATEEFDAKISYVNIPIVLQVYFGNFYVEGGPQVGFKVSEDVPDQTIEDFAKSSDFSAALGLGYESKIGLGISGRYTIGLSKVGDFDTGDIDPDFKNGVIQIGLFYTLFNKKK